MLLRVKVRIEIREKPGWRFSPLPSAVLCQLMLAHAAYSFVFPWSLLCIPTQPSPTPLLLAATLHKNSKMA